MNPALFLLLFQQTVTTVTLSGLSTIAAPMVTAGAVAVTSVLSGNDTIAGAMVEDGAVQAPNQPHFSTPLTRVFTFPQTYTQGIGLTSTPDTPALVLTLPGPTISVSA